MKTLVMVRTGKHTGRVGYIMGNFNSRHIKHIVKAFVHFFDGDITIHRLSNLSEQPAELFEREKVNA